MANKTYFQLLDTSWALLLNSLVGEMTLYNHEGSSIYVLISDTEITDFSGITNKDYVLLGGLVPTIDTPGESWVYVKANSAPSSLFYLPKGELDPDKDISIVSDHITTLTNEFDTHLDDTNDPHDTTKEQVDLGNIPNETVSIFDGNPPSGKVALDYIVHALKDIVSNHVENTDNPHNTTKEQLDLDNVVNYAIGILEDDILDINRDDLYASIAAVHTIVQSRELSVPFAKAGHVFDGPLRVLTDNERLVYDPVSETVTSSGTDLIVHEGLKVTFVNDSIIRTSRSLATDIIIPHASISSTVNPKPGWHYLYVDVNENSLIYSVGSTQVRPTYGIEQYGDGDWINISNGHIYNADGNQIKRTYISKVFVDSNGEIDRVDNIPMGKVYRMKTEVLVVPNTTYQFDNPFMAPVQVYPEIKIGDQWADPAWVDSIGVRAHYLDNEPDKIVVQTGALGIAAPANLSGNGFNDTNLPTTYSGSALLRLILKRM